MGQRLGKNVIPIMEKYGEFERLLGLASELKAPPSVRCTCSPFNERGRSVGGLWWRSLEVRGFNP